MDQTVLQRASQVHSGVPPCRAAWGAREQHKTANMVRQWTEDVVILQLVYSLGEWQYSRSFATILATYCNALRVLQER